MRSSRRKQPKVSLQEYEVSCEAIDQKNCFLTQLLEPTREPACGTSGYMMIEYEAHEPEMERT
ncbi:MAG: hypothetical protein AUF79_02985 [Crenarchaeota archaeon 13_1_20CM_2_51_8]|nr:MAG: hypothetical protein AUF79_02985 [Crenarchaeota archaeon 13_1_20CM_2_51_8]